MIPAALSAALIILKPGQPPELVAELPEPLEFTTAIEGEFIEGKPVRFVVARERLTDGKRGVLLTFASRHEALGVAENINDSADWQVMEVRPTDLDFLNRRKPEFYYQPITL